jgi:hypothetical protein
MQELPIKEFDAPQLISGPALATWKIRVTDALNLIDDEAKAQAYVV